MDSTALTIRPTSIADLAAIDDLLRRSYPALLAADYPPSVLVAALPAMARAQPRLLASGTYFVAERNDRVLAAGGYSWAGPTGGRQRGVAHIRHVVTDRDHVRQGIGRALMGKAMEHAVGRGARLFDCVSTRTAVPFYAALGFARLEDVTLRFGGAIDFPAVHMQRRA